jgi:hypothetical protein
LQRQARVSICAEAATFDESFHVQQGKAAAIFHPHRVRSLQHFVRHPLFADRVPELVRKNRRQRRGTATHVPLLDHDFVLPDFEEGTDRAKIGYGSCGPEKSRYS